MSRVFSQNSVPQIVIS